MGRFDDKEKALDLNEKGSDLYELEKYGGFIMTW